jgi:hypothetical protein
MIKHDSGKQRWDFVPFDALNEVVKVYTWGHDVEGYGPDNWKTVEPHDRYFAALHRHLTSWRCGEIHDKKSGLFAMAHVIFNAMCLLWFDLKEGSQPDIKTRFGEGRRCVDISVRECDAANVWCNDCGAITRGEL